MNKYVLFALIVISTVGLDLWTKRIAEDQLASVSRRWDHPIERTVETETDGGSTSVGDFLRAEFGADAVDARPPLVHGVYVVRGGEAVGPLPMGHELADGDVVRISHRQVTIVPGFWNHVYVQNFGAAWGFLSDGDAKWVRPFFLVVAIIAVFIVLRIFSTVRPDQKLLMVALSLIVGGALGNFADRARYGYVVDFIDWYATWGGEEHHWPTFNVADVWITIGVAFMILEILFGKEQGKAGAKVADPSDAEPSDEAASA